MRAPRSLEPRCHILYLQSAIRQDNYNGTPVQYSLTTREGTNKTANGTDRGDQCYEHRSDVHYPRLIRRPYRID